jgi:hypothetical protein
VIVSISRLTAVTLALLFSQLSVGQLLRSLIASRERQSNNPAGR